MFKASSGSDLALLCLTDLNYHQRADVVVTNKADFMKKDHTFLNATDKLAFGKNFYLHSSKSRTLPPFSVPLLS